MSRKIPLVDHSITVNIMKIKHGHIENWKYAEKKKMEIKEQKIQIITTQIQLFILDLHSFPLCVYVYIIHMQILKYK